MKELLKKTDAELNKLVNDKRESLRNFRFATAQAKIKNMKEGKNLRKEIAQALTILTSRKTK